MVRVPQTEYLLKITPSLADTASFGIDFGDIYRRSGIGVRVYGVPVVETEVLAACFARINDDFHKRAGNVEYHDGEMRYDYIRLNCATTIGAAFNFGAGYTDIDVSSAGLLSRRKVVAAVNASIPTEMALRARSDRSFAPHRQLGRSLIARAGRHGLRAARPAPAPARFIAVDGPARLELRADREDRPAAHQPAGRLLRHVEHPDVPGIRSGSSRSSCFRSDTPVELRHRSTAPPDIHS
jgi:hypothetical protein